MVGYVAQDPETQVVSTTVAAEIELPLEMRGDAAGRPRPGGRGGRPGARDPAPARPHRRHPLRRRAAARSAGGGPGHPPEPGAARRADLPARPRRRRRADLAAAPAERGVGGDVLLAEHRLERCLAAADRVVAMDAGADRLRRRPRRTSSPGPSGSDPALRPRRPASSPSPESTPSRRASAMPARPSPRRSRWRTAERPLRTACAVADDPRPHASRASPTSCGRGGPPSAPTPSGRDLWVELSRGERAARRAAGDRPDGRARRAGGADGPQRRRQEHAAADCRRAWSSRCGGGSRRRAGSRC